MSGVLNDWMIEKARELRATGMRYSDIARQIGYTGVSSNLRYHCRDLPTTRRILQPTRYAEGTGIRAFTDDEDKRIVDWSKLPQDERPSFHKMGQQLGRNGSSIRARVEWLKKNGRIGE